MNNTPKDGLDLPAQITRNGKNYDLVIIKRKYDDFWVIKYENANGLGSIWEFVESPSLIMAEIYMRNLINTTQNQVQAT